MGRYITISKPSTEVCEINIRRLGTDDAEEHQNQLLRADHGSLVYDILSEEASENICFCFFGANQASYYGGNERARNLQPGASENEFLVAN